MRVDKIWRQMLGTGPSMKNGAGGGPAEGRPDAAS